MIPISYSRASDFETCPLLFKAKNLDKVPQPASLPMQVGNFIHAVLDAHIQHCVRANRQTDNDELDDIARSLWDGRLSNKDWRAIPESMRNEVFGLVGRIKEGVLLQPEAVVGSEVELALTKDWKQTQWLAKDVFVRMKIDRLDMTGEDSALIWDCKTGRHIEQATNNMQLKVYGLGVRSIRPEFKVLRGELWFTRFNVTKGADLTDADVETARGWLLGVSTAVEACAASGKWEPTPGAGCAWCPVYDACPAKATAAALTAPKDQEMAQDLLGNLAMLERQVKEAKAKLKAWVEAYGAVLSHGMIAQIDAELRADWDVVEVARRLREAGIDPMNVMDVDNKKLQSILDDNPAVAEALMPLRTDKSRSKFTIKKGKEADE